MARLRAAIAPWTSLSGVVGAWLLALGIALSVRLQWDPDYWWHISVGDWILDHRDVPHTQWISWLADVNHWIDQEWGSDLIIASLNRAFGTLGSVAFFALVTIAIWLVFLSVVRMLLREQATPLALGASVLVASLVALPVWGPRAQLFTTLWALVVVRLAYGYLMRGQTRLIWLLPVVTVLWVNTHLGSILLMPAVLLAITVGDVVERRRQRVALAPPYLPYLAAIGVSLLAVLVNPYTFDAYLFAFQSSLGPVVQSVVAEWQSPDFHVLTMRPAQLFVAAGVAIIVPLGARRSEMRGLFLASGLLLMGLESVRFLGQYGPIAVAVLSPALALGTKRLFAWIRPAARGATEVENRKSWVLVVGLARVMIALATLALLASIPQTALNSTEQARETAATQPVNATPVLARWLASHPDARVLNTYEWGGYLNRELGVQVAAYGATEAYSASQFRELTDLLLLQTDPRPILARERVGVVILQGDSALAQWFAVAPDWRLLYKDSLAVIFVPTG
jgi:hypothetical protein